jgi:condensin complex subunit 1
MISSDVRLSSGCFLVNMSKRVLTAAVASVASDPASIGNEEVLDIYRNILKASETVPAGLMMKLLDSLSSGFQATIEVTNRDVDQLEQDELAERKLVLDIYGFLLSWFVMAADKVKVSDEDASVAPKPRRGRGGKAAATGRTGKAGKAEWTWITQVDPTLALICRAFKMRSARLWGTTADRDTFVECVLLF